MQPTRPAGMLLAIILLSAIGCTHIQLRNNTLHQAQAVHQLQQQQVLDNLALFMTDPNAVPYFTVVGSGGSAVNDSGSASTALNWLATGFQSVGLMLGGQRLAQENFSLAPVTDPDKLARMRCAYQAAVGAGGSPCIDCCELQRKWGAKKWDGRPAPTECPDQCLPGPGWFCFGKKASVPKHACHVGRYCGTYVWVLPEGTDDFARLTLTILDYATSVPGPPKTKTVKTTWKDGEKTIEETVEVPLNAKVDVGPGAAPHSEQPSSVRQNFYFPQQQTPVVIPLPSL